MLECHEPYQERVRRNSAVADQNGRIIPWPHHRRARKPIATTIIPAAQSSALAWIRVVGPNGAILIVADDALNDCPWFEPDPVDRVGS